jgi:hypothetical protein
MRSSTPMVTKHICATILRELRVLFPVENRGDTFTNENEQDAIVRITMFSNDNGCALAGSGWYLAAVKQSTANARHYRSADERIPM